MRLCQVFAANCVPLLVVALAKKHEKQTRVVPRRSSGRNYCIGLLLRFCRRLFEASTMPPTSSSVFMSGSAAGFLIYAYKGAFVGIGTIGFLDLVCHPGGTAIIKELRCKFHVYSVVGVTCILQFLMEGLIHHRTRREACRFSC